MKGGGFLGVAGDKWGRQPEAFQQHHQPLADPPSPDSTKDPKISAYFNATSTSSRSSTVRRLDLRTSRALRRNSTKASALFYRIFRCPPRHPIGSEWVAPFNKNHKLEALQELVPHDSRRGKKLTSKSHLHSGQICCQTCSYQARSSTLINSH